MGDQLWEPDSKPTHETIRVEENETVEIKDRFITPVIDEDWDLLAKLVENTTTEYPDDTPEERELRIEMAVQRHVNQQKVMSYSKLNETNPMALLDPTDLAYIRIDLILERLCPEEEDRLAFELGFEHAVTAHVDRTGMMIARSRAQAMAGQVEQPHLNRQQRRQYEKDALKSLRQRG